MKQNTLFLQTAVLGKRNKKNMFKSLNGLLYKTLSLNHRLPAHPRPPWTSPPGYPESVMKYKEIRFVPLLLLPSLERRGQGGDPKQTLRVVSKGPEISQERKACRVVNSPLKRKMKTQVCWLGRKFLLSNFLNKGHFNIKDFFPVFPVSLFSKCLLAASYLLIFHSGYFFPYFFSGAHITPTLSSPYLFPELSVELMVSHSSRFNDFLYNTFYGASLTIMK